MTVGSRIEHALSRRLDSARPPRRAAPCSPPPSPTDERARPGRAERRRHGGRLEAAEAAGLVRSRRAASCSATRSCAPSCSRAPSRPSGAPRTAPTPPRWMRSGDDRAVWHAAAGAVAPDEAIAAALTATGERARAARRPRGGDLGVRAGGAADARSPRRAPRGCCGRRTRRLARRRRPARARAAGEAAAVLPATGSERPAAGHLRGRVLARHGPVTAAIRVLRDGAEAVAPRIPRRRARCWPRPRYATVVRELGRGDGRAGAARRRARARRRRCARAAWPRPRSASRW